MRKRRAIPRGRLMQKFYSQKLYKNPIKMQKLKQRLTKPLNFQNFITIRLQNGLSRKLFKNYKFNIYHSPTQFFLKESLPNLILTTKICVRSRLLKTSYKFI